MVPRLIVAELISDNECRAVGLVAHGAAPVLQLCRLLIEAGYDPSTPLEAFRGMTLALRVKSLAEGARLTVKRLEGTAKLSQNKDDADRAGVIAGLGDHPVARLMRR